MKSQSSQLKTYPDWMPPMLVAEIRSDSQWYFPWILGAFFTLLQFYFDFNLAHHDLQWIYVAIVAFLLVEGWGYATSKWSQENMDLLQMAGISPTQIILARWAHLMAKCTLMVGFYALIVKVGSPELGKTIHWTHVLVFQCCGVGLAMSLGFYQAAAKALIIFIGLILMMMMNTYHIKEANPIAIWTMDLVLSALFGYSFAHIKIYSLYGGPSDGATVYENHTSAPNE